MKNKKNSKNNSKIKKFITGILNAKRRFVENQTQFKLLLILILFILSIQLFITYLYTNTKEFSKRSFIRNISVGLGIYYTVIYENPLFLLVPVIIEVILEFLKLQGYHMEKYISTKYQYNDYWRDINKNDPIFSNFSEGIYDKILGFDTIDHSQKNLEKILNWSKEIYKDSIINQTRYLKDINGKKHDGIKLKKFSENKKFELICNICNIKPNMRVLEIGFGEGDFMIYLKEKYNISPIGVSISNEQVKLIKQKGFQAYCMNSWDMTNIQLGTFDLILQCGNLEYIKCTGESYVKYYEYSKKINSLLNSNGKYFITCIHFNDKFKLKNLYDNINCYFLWSGNDGSYPNGKNGFSKYAEKAGLKNIYQQERTMDYLITTVIYMSYLQCMKGKCVNSMTILGLTDACVKTIAAPYYLHTYLCYSPTIYFDWLPWQWQFIPQKINDEYITPVTLEYICFQKK